MSTSLQHHGILGMKWGVRKERNLREKEASLRKERSRIKSDKGVLSSSYRAKSKKLYVTKKKADLQEAKNSGDKAAKMVAKQEYKWAKSQVKDAGLYTTSVQRDIFGSNVSSNDLAAIGITERKVSAGRARAKRILQTVGPVAVSGLSAVAIAEGKYYVANGRFGVPSFGFNDGKPEIRVK